MQPMREDRPNGWWIYRGTGGPHDGIDDLPPPPPWRTFAGGPLVTPRFSDDPEAHRRLGDGAYVPDDRVIEMMNTALLLRRPLLVTGRPGTGKSTLAYSVAAELRLGPVLHWPITSRSTLNDALYRYDAIGRLQEASLRRGEDPTRQPPDIGRFVRLGPVGTALVPQLRPRVLLIDEIDKSDVDLPSDLLHVFETGRFTIPELARLPDEQSTVEVLTDDESGSATVRRGVVACRAFPVVVVTSNGERTLPPAFLRRCLRLEIAEPSREQLASIIQAQLGPDVLEESIPLIEQFIERRATTALATDQLINAIYLATSARRPPDASRERVLDALLADLGR